ncbi:MAG: T9SS type A sorting domain-containing protein [Bacteroidia bacterium]|nr:T9SS type A sorting domain-containing protein [Bacteroidia bacterium]
MYRNILVCNVFQNSYRGFYGSGANAFNAVILNDQLTISSVGYPTGNTFTGSVTADLTGAIRNSSNQAINWYFTGTPLTNALAPGSLTNTNQPIFSSNPTQCANPIFVSPSSANQREILAGSQIEISESTVADETTKEMSAKDAHKLLVEHPDWLNLNTLQDGDYQQFFAATDTTEIAKANYTEIAALADNEQQAILQNTALSGASDVTGNHKTVFEIYNRSWLKDSVTLTAADSATLLAIALQHPAQGGEAVYTARVMLRLFVDDATGNYYNFRVAATSETLTPSVEVFPNPANNQITITGHYTETDVVVFSLYDLTGRLMLTEQLKTGNGTLNLDLGAVQPGAFLYQITVNGAVTTTDKLVIAR